MGIFNISEINQTGSEIGSTSLKLIAEQYTQDALICVANNYQIAETHSTFRKGLMVKDLTVIRKEGKMSIRVSPEDIVERSIPPDFKLQKSTEERRRMAFFNGATNRNLCDV